MKLQGRYVQIAGSGSDQAPESQLRYAHDLSKELACELLRQGATLVLTIGQEPHRELPLFFDWSMIEAVHECWRNGSLGTRSDQDPLIVAVANPGFETTITKVREPIRSAYNQLDRAEKIRLERVNGFAGPLIQERQEEFGDALIAISGGEGVRHSARLYRRAGKPVVPLDLDIGAAFAHEGSQGAAARLVIDMREEPDSYGRLKRPERRGALVASLTTNQGERPLEEVTRAMIGYIAELQDPPAFCVRLLDKQAPDYKAVERFFQEVVTPELDVLGYTPDVMEQGEANQLFIPQEIFDRLFRSRAVIADFTGLRPNCFLELGYALGLSKPVIVAAREGTTLPFDAAPIGCHFWKHLQTNDARRKAFRDHWQRNIGRAPVVRAPRFV